MHKKIIFTLTALLVFMGSAAAVTREKTGFTPGKVMPKHEIKGDFVYNGRTFHLGKPGNEAAKIKTRGVESTPVIENAPGKKQNYCKDVIGYGLGMPIQAYAVASSINWDGNDAYFLDIITAAPMGTYVKGVLSGNQVRVPMNQTVLEFEDEEYDLNFGLLKPVFTVDPNNPTDVYVWFEYSDDYDSIDFSINENGTMELISPPAKYTNDGPTAGDYGFPDYVIGYYYSDDLVWGGYCDVFQIYDEFNFEKTELPEGIEMTTMTYINRAGMGVIVNVGETADAVYMEGLSAYVPDGIVKGDFINDGTQISVAPNQYVGLEANLYYIITSTGAMKGNEIEWIQDEPAIFDVLRDPATGKILTISAVDSKNFLTFSDDPFYFYPFDIFKGIVLSRQESFAGIPATPKDAYYGNYASMMGSNFVFFRLSSFAKNGDIIDINNLYYSVFLNGEPLEFEEQTGLNLLDKDVVMYSGIKEPTYLVPYTFANDIDLYEDMGGTFVVGLYAEGIETVGVQAVYICDGVTTTGGLVTINTATGEQTITPGSDAKVESIQIDEVVGVDYYDLNGRQMNNPQKGLYVKKYTMKDGRTISRTVLVR